MSNDLSPRMKHCIIHPSEYYEETCPSCDREQDGSTTPDSRPSAQVQPVVTRFNINDFTIFGQITVIDFVLCFMQFKRDDGTYWSKTFEEIASSLDNNSI